MKNTLTFALIALGLSVSTTSEAAELPSPTSFVEGITVNRVLTYADGRFGGCTALLNLPKKMNGKISEACPNPFVAFGCDGTHTSKDTALMMLDQAQLALALGKKILVEVDGSKKYGDVCLVTRIDVIK